MTTSPDNERRSAAQDSGSDQDIGGRADAGLMPIDMACAGCGYGLIGESFDGNCPQCDGPVSATARPDDLVLASAAHLTMLSRGLALVQGGLIGQIVSVVAVIAFSVLLGGMGITLSNGS
ncbi:MAG: hypothetical protein AAF297_12400, partial [Planctomycetota bacterium]